MENNRKRQVEPTTDGRRRRFLKKAGAIAVAVPVMESLSKEGLLVKSAHAQSAVVSVESVFGGPIGTIV